MEARENRDRPVHRRDPHPGRGRPDRGRLPRRGEHPEAGVGPRGDHGDRRHHDQRIQDVRGEGHGAGASLPVDTGERAGRGRDHHRSWAA